MMQDGTVLPSRHSSGNEYPEVAHVLVHQVDDALTCGDQVRGRRVYRLEPAERLVGRRDVVAVGAEDHQGRANASEVRSAVVVNDDLAVLQMVADKQITRNRQHFLAGDLIEAVPPAFELQETVALALRLREQGVVLLKYAFRPQCLEVLDKPGAVEASGTEVGDPVRRPDATSEPAQETHRVDAPLTGPVRQR